MLGIVSISLVGLENGLRSAHGVRILHEDRMQILLKLGQCEMSK